jgi:hypothetical protein
MGKYDALGGYLSKQFGREIPMTFSEIEKVIGGKLPPTAEHHRAWWSNNPNNNVMTKVWLEAGFQTAQVDIAARKLIFKRKRGDTSPSAAPRRTIGVAIGMSDVASEFKQDEGGGNKKVARHPASGALKGTFTIEPGYDLTRPMLDEDELAQWEAKLNRIADELDAHLSRKK